MVESASDHGDYWDAIYINKGHALRKLGLYDLAIATFEQALLKCQDPGPVLSALGLTHHLLGNLEIAIDFYHKSLAVDPGSAVAGVLISKAISATVAPLH